MWMVSSGREEEVRGKIKSYFAIVPERLKGSRQVGGRMTSLAFRAEDGAGTRCSGVTTLL